MVSSYHKKLLSASGGKGNPVIVVDASSAQAMHTSFDNGASFSTFGVSPCYPTMVAYGNDIYVGVETSGRDIVTSQDGINWTARLGIALTSPYDYRALAYGAGLFVCLSNSSSGTGSPYAMTSPDGVTWTARTVPTEQWRNLKWSGTEFVAVCNPPGGTNYVYTSPDGLTWTKRTVATTEVRQGLAYGNGTWVVAEQSNTLYSTDGGVTWTSTTNAADAYSCINIIYSPELGLFVFLTASGTGTYGTSNDGISWVSRTLPITGKDFRFGTWTGTHFVLIEDVSTGGQVLSSVDGINWVENVSLSGTYNVGGNNSPIISGYAY